MTAKSSFVGREYELGLLKEQEKMSRPSLIIVYGRRRVGKTRLITQFYKDEELWRFDGVENEGKQVQIKNILERLSKYTGDSLYRSAKCDDWLELLKIMDRAISSSRGKYKKCIFLDEFQYTATRHTELVSALKWAWDNMWKDKLGFTLVLCGSVASFMIQKVVMSSALYGRTTLEICLKPLSIPEVCDFFGKKKSIREICDLYMFCGGIPEYLLQMDYKKSVHQNIAGQGFCKDGYFVNEFDRLFKDIFREEKIYKLIVQSLSEYGSLKLSEIAQMLDISEGGGLTDCLENLKSAGFVEDIVPWNKEEGSKLKRYRLSDEYLFFYFKFIHPNLKKIRQNIDPNFGVSILKGRSFKSWAGFSFERLCLKHVHHIMEFLKIDQLVKDYGAYFDRASNTKEGVQIDLMLVRHDPVVTICEMKYSESLIGKSIIEEVERKVELLGEKKKTVDKVLITTLGATKDLIETNYFSNIITLEELFGQ